jgi:hypothetical protein
VVQEGRQGRRVGWHGVIAEEPANHLSQPSPLCRERLVPAPHQLDLQLLEGEMQAFQNLSKTRCDGFLGLSSNHSMKA